ncbi:MAG: hypothetical protein R3F56_07745 [Planctomycetota bacterium]
MEDGVFVRDPAVVGILKESFVESRLHSDAPTDYPAQTIDPLRRRYIDANPAMGIYVAIDPNTEEPLARLFGTKPAEFEGFLRRALAARKP